MTSQEAADLDALVIQLEANKLDAMRWRWFIRHASLGFDGAPSWNAVMRLPVFDHADQTITALVDRARYECQPTKEST